MKKVAIITARGGSKRIPRKNIKPFLGKPIIAYSIEAALQSGVFDEVMVSTDDNEIAEIAQQYGATVPFMRSAKTSDDHATSADVLEEVILSYRDRGEDFDTFCCIYPTAPFVTPEKLRSAQDLFLETDANSVFTVTQFSYPPQRAVVVRDKMVVFQYPEYANTRSQDLEPIYHDCGQFYFMKTSALLKYHTLVPPKAVPFIVSDAEVQDIDNESDWLIAEAKYRVLQDAREKM